MAFKKCKSWPNLFASVFLPDFEMTQARFVNYIDRCLNYTFYFGHLQNFEQYLYLSDLLKAFFMAIENWFLDISGECGNSCFVKKDYSKPSYNCVFILSRKRPELVADKLSYFRKSWSWNHSLNCIFNAQAIGVQNTFLILILMTWFSFELFIWSINFQELSPAHKWIKADFRW